MNVILANQNLRPRFPTGVSVLALAASLSACAGSGGAPTNGFPGPSANGAQPAVRRAGGPGVIVSSKFGGPIYGWAINENGTDGFFTEAPMVGYTLVSTIETFDQTSGKITKSSRGSAASTRITNSSPTRLSQTMWG